MTLEAAEISTEAWREYSWQDPVSKDNITHRIDKPQRLYIGRSTHRVVDSEGITHLVPSVGQLGCVVRFKGEPEVSF